MDEEGKRQCQKPSSIYVMFAILHLCLPASLISLMFAILLASVPSSFMLKDLINLPYPNLHMRMH